MSDSGTSTSGGEPAAPLPGFARAIRTAAARPEWAEVEITPEPTPAERRAILAALAEEPGAAAPLGGAAAGEDEIGGDR